MTTPSKYNPLYTQKLKKIQQIRKYGEIVQKIDLPVSTAHFSLAFRAAGW